jgi:hypothetical protein
LELRIDGADYAVGKEVREFAMLGIEIRRVVLSGLLALAAVPSGSVTAAAASFDGNWSVLIMTDAGTCDRAYRYGVRIAGGRIYYQGGGPSVSGRVDPSGRVVVSLRYGESAAHGSGRLSRSVGYGRWQGASSAMRCSGRWQASRGGY